MDKDNNGSIDIAELKKAYQNMEASHRHNIPKSEIDSIVKEIDYH